MKWSEPTTKDSGDDEAGEGAGFTRKTRLGLLQLFQLKQGIGLVGVSSDLTHASAADAARC